MNGGKEFRKREAIKRIKILIQWYLSEGKVLKKCYNQINQNFDSMVFEWRKKVLEKRSDRVNQDFDSMVFDWRKGSEKVLQSSESIF